MRSNPNKTKKKLRNRNSQLNVLLFIFFHVVDNHLNEFDERTLVLEAPITGALNIQTELV